MERTYWAAKVIGASSQWDERGKRKKGTEEGWGWVTRNTVEGSGGTESECGGTTKGQNRPVRSCFSGAGDKRSLELDHPCVGGKKPDDGASHKSQSLEARSLLLHTYNI